MVRGVSNPTPEVPALKHAIEQRMAELGLSPTDLVDATGVTYQGLLHLRQGRRKNYQRRLTGPVCAAFGWTPDSIDRILSGGKPLLVKPVQQVEAGGASPDDLHRIYLILDHLEEIAENVMAALSAIPELAARLPGPTPSAESPTDHAGS